MADTPPTAPARFRPKLRHLLILNVYLAVALAGVVFVVRSWGDGSSPPILVAAGAVGVFAALTPVATLVHRPGPARDWAAAVFFALTWVAAATGVSVGLVAALRFRAGVALVDQRMEMTLLAGFGALMFLPTAVAVRRAIPRRCPSCGRRALVPAQPERAGPFRHFWCARCGARWKRSSRRAGAWKEASGPGDDRHYRLGSPLSWWRSRGGRPPAR